MLEPTTLWGKLSQCAWGTYIFMEQARKGGLSSLVDETRCRSRLLSSSLCHSEYKVDQRLGAGLVMASQLPPEEHAGHYTLLAGKSLGYLLVGREVLHNLDEFPASWAINSSSCCLEQLWIYPFLCFGCCGCAQTTGVWTEYFVLIEMRLCSFPSSRIFFWYEQFIFCLVLG